MQEIEAQSNQMYQNRESTHVFQLEMNIVSFCLKVLSSCFLATLVALHLTPVSKRVIVSD